MNACGVFCRCLTSSDKPASAGQLHSAEPPAQPYPLWDNRETVSEYAQKANLPPTMTLDLGGGVKMEMILIPAGKFIMGKPEREDPIVGVIMLLVSGGILAALIGRIFGDAWKKQKERSGFRPQYSLGYLMLMMFVASFTVWGGVRLWQATRPVYGYCDAHPAYEVTLTKPFYIGKYHVTQEQYQQVMGNNPSGFKGKDSPVEMVSWDDAQEFCKQVSEEQKLTVRLPSEAEWDYACRFGLYEISFPYGQWCQDWYGEYKADAAVDPQGAANGVYRVLRGGGGDRPPENYLRRSEFPNHRDDFIGFRVVVPAFRTP